MKAFLGDATAAWSPFEPSKERPWNRVAAAHLFRRAGFGANWGELERARSEGLGQTLERFFQPEASVAAFNAEADRFESDGSNVRGVDELRGSWLRRMIISPDPLTEKTTLFWHGWFGVRADRLPSAAPAWAHIRMLRSHALGRFDALLLAAVHSPAVLLSAGGRENPKARPNLHLARQMLACFTAGEGQFTERDVTETARAFTGMFIRGDQLHQVPREHDEGEKTILGQTGPWNAQDFARIAAAHPAVAHRVTGKLYRWLIADQDDPPSAQIEPLARSFQQDRDVGKLIRTLLASNLFYSAAAYRQRVKSPVEFAAGLCRAFETQVPSVRLAQDVAGLGQDLYHPPTIQGWAGGRAWINPATLAGRQTLAATLLAGSGPYENRLDPLPLAQKHGHGQNDPLPSTAFLGELLLQGDFPPAMRAVLERHAGTSTSTGAGKSLRTVATLLAGSPEYQLA